MKNVSIGRLGAAIFVLGSIAGTLFFSGPRNRKKRTEIFRKQQEKLDENYIAPANQTFAIVWPVIYLGTAALAIHQALPSQRDNVRYQKALPWLLTSYGLNALFGYFFSSGKKASRVAAGVTTLATLPPAILLHKSLEIGKTEAPYPENIFQKSISLYAGWVTAASVVGTSNLLLEAGYQPDRAQAVPLAEGVLALTGTLGDTISRKLHDPYYLLPFVAAFSGIAVKQYTRSKMVAGVSVTLAVATAGRIAQQLWKVRHAQESANIETEKMAPQPVADSQPEPTAQNEGWQPQENEKTFDPASPVWESSDSSEDTGNVSKPGNQY